MILRNRLALWVVAVLLMSSALAQAKTVTLGAADNRTDVFLNLGDTLEVELSSGQVNGFRWVSHLPNPSTLTPLNDEVLPADKSARVPVQIARFRFNAATVGDTALVFGFESAVKTPGAAPQDTSAYSVRVHVALGSPQLGTAVLYGVYKGTLPCADCSGLETVLRLYAKGKFDTTYAFYVRTQTYRGAPHGYVVLSDRGEWAVLRGDATNPDATVYQLNPDDEQHSDSWLVSGQGSLLLQLDRDQKPIDSKMNLTLRRVN
ncbi:copper resistance protein NlpE N-terminal domain-containing protein [Tunturiibacter lichenicola]|jgi:copper homeostasis protein (lipoprotein)|uniref:copper resistance protein NlpE N-terminal domain-containing protein n=1 Tax=Tunturiibacter lichenicola TaxID=2051959 RepID=UPI003D9BBFE1